MLKQNKWCSAALAVATVALIQFGLSGCGSDDSSAPAVVASGVSTTAPYGYNAQGIPCNGPSDPTCIGNNYNVGSNYQGSQYSLAYRPGYNNGQYGLNYQGYQGGGYLPFTPRPFIPMSSPYLTANIGGGGFGGYFYAYAY